MVFDSEMLLISAVAILCGVVFYVVALRDEPFGQKDQVAEQQQSQR